MTGTNEPRGCSLPSFMSSKNLDWRRLTPELSRTDLRPWQNNILPWTAEAAKRSRLERIVSAESSRDYWHARLLWSWTSALFT